MEGGGGVTAREDRRIGAMNRLHARLSGLTRPARAFVSQPEPRSVGLAARGRQIMAGNFPFAGYLVQSPDRSIWDLDMPSHEFEDACHGFAWLDDLAAVGGGEAQDLARRWVWEWIARYGGGRGPGWTPDLTGRRLTRWVAHALFLLSGAEEKRSRAFFRSLGRQTVFLGRRWRAAAPGLPRFEALTGLVYAGLSLEGMDGRAPTAAAALAAECRMRVGEDGGIETRNPEELLEVLVLLVWARRSLDEAERDIPAELEEAIGRVAATLRALRHADGGLVRLHGGGRGREGRLDRALSESGARPGGGGARMSGRAMGVARLAAGRTTLLVDAAAPPTGPASAQAHASTLAMELTSGRRPLVVSCGSGAPFGADWRRAGRATPSHSVLEIEGHSSARLSAPVQVGGRTEEWLQDGPREVRGVVTHGPDGPSFHGTHDGWRASHGLVHMRQLDLDPVGRGVIGEEVLSVLDTGDADRFDDALTASGLDGVPVSVRFHLHPDVSAEIDMGGAAVSLMPPSGEVWVFRHDGLADLTLEPSVYLEAWRLRPRGTLQIRLAMRVRDPLTRLRWSLAKAQDTPTYMRDYATDETEEDMT